MKTVSLPGCLARAQLASLVLLQGEDRHIRLLHPVTSKWRPHKVREPLPLWGEMIHWGFQPSQPHLEDPKALYKDKGSASPGPAGKWNNEREGPVGKSMMATTSQGPGHSLSAAKEE